MNIRDKKYSQLIKSLLETSHKGVGFVGEGSCLAGNYIYAATNFFIPLKSTPTAINLTNLNYINSQNAIVWQKNKYGFIVRAKAINQGKALCIFTWTVQF